MQGPRLSPGHAEKGEVERQHVKEACLPLTSWLDVETWPWDLELLGYIVREAKLTTIVPAIPLSPRHLEKALWQVACPA